jgi:uncharacterized protein involved in response to NO
MTTRLESPSAPWQWQQLQQAPHRLGFALAMAVLMASGVWWAAVQLQRGGAGLPLSCAVSPSLMHAAVMTFGFIPLFFCGFLFTAGPKWLGVRPLPTRAITPALYAQFAGWLMWLAGGHLHPVAAGAGLLMALGGLARVTILFCRFIAASAAPDRVHAKVIAVALIVGCVSLAGLAGSLTMESPSFARLCVLTGLWGFVVVVYLTVSHRMIPFFTATSAPLVRTWGAWRVLWLMLGAAGFEVAATWLEPVLGGQGGWQLARGLVELIAGLAVVALAISWGLIQSLKIRLLAMLHLGFLWLGLALMLGGIAQLMSWMLQVPVLPLAALHALTMGCLGSLMLAMVTRVSCGHSGRSLVADNRVWTLFWLLQAATVLRIAATVPALPSQQLFTLAALLWAAVVLIWGLRYGSWYGRPRADGRPG